MKQLSTRTIAIIALVAVAILAIGVFVVQDNTTNPPVADVENEGGMKNQDGEENGEGEESIPETVDTSNWQTYRNEELGFEVKYPGEVIIHEYPEVTYFTIHNTEYIQYSEFAVFKYDSFKDAQNGHMDSMSFHVKKERIGEEMLDIYGIFAHGGNYYASFIESRSGVYVIKTVGNVDRSNKDNSSVDFQEIINPLPYAILQSFTLLDPQESL